MEEVTIIGIDLAKRSLSVIRMNGTAGAVFYRRLWLIVVDVMPPVGDGPGGVCGLSVP